MNSDPSPDTWHSRDLPVLREIVQRFDDNICRPIPTRPIADVLGISTEDLERACVSLAADGLIEIGGHGPYRADQAGRVSGEARRQAGSWPTPETTLDRMIAALEAIAANTDEDEDTRTRARKILDGLTGAGHTIGLSVATALITGQTPSS